MALSGGQEGSRQLGFLVKILRSRKFWFGRCPGNRLYREICFLPVRQFLTEANLPSRLAASVPESMEIYGVGRMTKLAGVFANDNP